MYRNIFTYVKVYFLCYIIYLKYKIHVNIILFRYYVVMNHWISYFQQHVINSRKKNNDNHTAIQDLLIFRYMDMKIEYSPHKNYTG